MIVQINSDSTVVDRIDVNSRLIAPPSPPLDNIQVMVIVWRLRGNIIRTASCWVV